MKPLLIQYWHDPGIPDDVGELLALAQRHNPGLRHMVFDERAAAELIESHFSPREAAAFSACAVPAMQADYFRYCAIYALGGVYCDADSRCSGSLASLLEVDGALFDGVRTPGVITNHLFAFRQPEHPLLKLAVEIATSGIETRFSEKVVWVTGPHVLTALATILRLGSIEDFVENRKEMLDSEAAASFVNRERALSHLESIREIIGDHSRVAAAFDGVRVRPYAEIVEVVSGGGPQLAYRKGPDHFPNWKGSIYR